MDTLAVVVYYLAGQHGSQESSGCRPNTAAQQFFEKGREM